MEKRNRKLDIHHTGGDRKEKRNSLNVTRVLAPRRRPVSGF